MPESDGYFTDTRGLLSLWAGVLLAPLAFLLNLQVTYALAAMACDHATPWLHTSSLLMLLLALGGGWLAWRDWRRTGGGQPGDGGGAVPRSRFLAVLGLMTSALFALIILMQWMAVLILQPCREI
jgi:hypothetical protein